MVNSLAEKVLVTLFFMLFLVWEVLNILLQSIPMFIIMAIPVIILMIGLAYIYSFISLWFFGRTKNINYLLFLPLTIPLFVFYNGAQRNQAYYDLLADFWARNYIAIHSIYDSVIIYCVVVFMFISYRSIKPKRLMIYYKFTSLGLMIISAFSIFCAIAFSLLVHGFCVILWYPVIIFSFSLATYREICKQKEIEPS